MSDTVEIICTQCSKTFESEDNSVVYCPECWKKMLEEYLKNEGKNVK